MLRGSLYHASTSEPPEFLTVPQDDLTETQCDLCGAAVISLDGKEQHREWHRVIATVTDAVMVLSRRLR